MNYYDARQITDGDGEPTDQWHYTVMNDGVVRPVGTCATEACAGGHDSEDGARQCYTTYLLDESLKLEGEWVDTQHKCEVCQSWTQKFASVGFTVPRTFNLCDDHRTREHVEALHGIVGAVASS